MEIIITAQKRWWNFNWRELWKFRDLFYFLTWRDVKVKYKQTVIGVLWVVFQPFITMVIFSIFFGHLGKIPSDGIPYPIFVYTGLLFWTLFATSLTTVSDSFVANERMLTKIYFPRIILPISSIITNMIDFLVAAVILLGMMMFYHFTPSWTIILVLPVLLFMTLLSVLGIGLLFASLNVKYRDVRHALPFFIQSLIFITPVIYPVSLISERFRWILYLNPMAGVVDAARSIVLHTGVTSLYHLSISCASILVSLVIGVVYFKHTEKYFADII